MKTYQLYMIIKMKNGTKESRVTIRRASTSGNAISAESKNWGEDYLDLICIADSYDGVEANVPSYQLRGEFDTKFGVTV